jgi:hypothetical protein
MARESHHGRIAGEAVLVLDNRCRALRDGVQDFAVPVMAVDTTTQSIAAF